MEPVVSGDGCTVSDIVMSLSSEEWAISRQALAWSIGDGVGSTSSTRQRDRFALLRKYERVHALATDPGFVAP